VSSIKGYRFFESPKIVEEYSCTYEFLNGKHIERLNQLDSPIGKRFFSHKYQK
jgi:hypothetical protein